MTDARYDLIGDMLDWEIFDQVRNFHAKTQNVLLHGSPKKERLSEAYKAKIGLLEHSDIPITPFEEGRVHLGRFSKDFEITRNPSATHFGGKLLPYEALSNFLKVSFGETRIQEERPFRNYPSGGALYSVQVIVGIRPTRFLKDASFSAAFYHYRPHLHVLDFLAACDENVMVEAVLNKESKGLSSFSFAIFYVCFLPKVLCKYDYRGYRLSLLEAGSMYQQASQFGKNLGLTNRVWSFFEDQRICHLLKLNPVSYYPLIAQIFGDSDV